MKNHPLCGWIFISNVIGFGGKINLHCPLPDIHVNEIKPYIKIEFLEIKDKHVNNIVHKGMIVAASKTHAVIVTDIDLHPFDNLEICGENGVYCKVLEKIIDGYFVAFTTDSSPILGNIELI